MDPKFVNVKPQANVHVSAVLTKLEDVISFEVLADNMLQFILKYILYAVVKQRGTKYLTIVLCCEQPDCVNSRGNMFHKKYILFMMPCKVKTTKVAGRYLFHYAIKPIH